MTESSSRSAAPPSLWRLLRGTIALALGLLGACGAVGGGRAGESGADVLLFDGAGASANDVDAVAAVLSGAGLAFARADAGDIAALAPSRLGRYRLIVIPGGDFVAMADGLGPKAAARLRGAVRGGTAYLGICAGGFLAGRFSGKGLDLAAGRKFGFYAAEARGIRKAAVPISTPGAPPLDQYWEDGPQFAGWGAVLGRYPDGSPAMVEGRFGRGRVILVGVHPEAPESWRKGMRFATPASADHAFAARLVRAAYAGEPLAAF